MSKMLKNAIAATTPTAGLRKAGDADIDPAAPPPAAAAARPAAKRSPAPGARKKTAAKAEASDRVPFGSYLSRDLHRRFKVACVAGGVEMRDALEEAVAAWVAKNSPK